MSLETTTNFIRSDGLDLGRILITKDYLISVYPSIGQQIGIPPELWVWGRATYGQLGNASTVNTSTPVTTFDGGTNWKQVSSGVGHIAAIKTDGTLWTWGDATYVQLGNNNNTIRTTPVTTFAGGTNWKQVSAGFYHTAAIKTDGTLWTWGFADRGALGTGGEPADDNRSTPVTTFAGGTNWKQVSAGSQHTAAIKTDGTLWTWGDGEKGQLGNNLDSVSASRSTPITTFAGGTNWKQVSSGFQHTAAIKNDGTLWTWGAGGGGVLGGSDGYDRLTPITTFAGGTNWKQVSNGFTHMSAIKTDGTLWTWGFGLYGQLGINSASVAYTPITTFAGGTNWKQVSCGLFEIVAIKTDGTLWTWGRGNNGQLGNASTTNRSTPVTTFTGGTNWKQVSGGGYLTAAIESVDF
jgi:alpha-tubulin suppressor-like RCC1 family protein